MSSLKAVIESACVKVLPTGIQVSAGVVVARIRMAFPRPQMVFCFQLPSQLLLQRPQTADCILLLAYS